MTPPREAALRARAASRQLQAMPTAERVAMLNRVADALVAAESEIMDANRAVSRRGIVHCDRGMAWQEPVEPRADATEARLTERRGARAAALPERTTPHRLATPLRAAGCCRGARQHQR